METSRAFSCSRDLNVGGNRSPGRVPLENGPWAITASDQKNCKDQLLALRKMEVWRLPQGRYVDAVKWLPPGPAWKQRQVLAAALWDPDSGSSLLEISALHCPNDEGDEEGSSTSKSAWLESRASWPQTARITALKALPIPPSHSLLAYASERGDISFLVTDPQRPSGRSVPLVAQGLHRGPVAGLDVEANSHDAVCVGEDGRINVVKVAQSELHPRCLEDNRGVMSHTAVCWASPMEFVTAGLGSTLQWWDHRRPGGPVSQSPAKWAGGDASGHTHSLDVHPSRKHVCVVGSSGGSVLVWDLRWQQEPIALAGPSAKGQGSSGLVSESEVWQVKYDMWSPLAAGRGKLPPVMMCSEDGVLAVLDGGEALELLAEPCAINGFDIDTEGGTDVICGLEQESILYLKRAS